jgi:hypothetical protein
LPSGVDRANSGAFSPTAGGAAIAGVTAAKVNRDIRIRFMDGTFLSHRTIEEIDVASDMFGGENDKVTGRTIFY